MENFCKGLGAFSGGVVATTVLYPMEVTKTRVQVFGGKSGASNLGTMTDEEKEKQAAYTNVFKALAYIWKNEGYKALCPPWAQGYVSKCFDTGVFNFVTQKEKKGDWETAVEMWKEGGIANFYKGLGAVLALTVNASINLTIFDKTKEWWLNRVNKALMKKTGGKAKLQVGLSVLEGFLIGMWSKFIAATVCYPITRVKMLCVSQSKKRSSGEGQEGDGKILGAVEMAKKVYASDGLAGFFYGIEGQVTNASLKQALNLMVKERIQLLIFAIFMPSYLKVMQAKAAAAAAAAAK